MDWTLVDKEGKNTRHKAITGKTKSEVKGKCKLNLTGSSDGFLFSGTEPLVITRLDTYNPYQNTQFAHLLCLYSLNAPSHIKNTYHGYTKHTLS